MFSVGANLVETAVVSSLGCSPLIPVARYVLTKLGTAPGKISCVLHKSLNPKVSKLLRMSTVNVSARAPTYFVVTSPMFWVSWVGPPTYSGENGWFVLHDWPCAKMCRHRGIHGHLSFLDLGLLVTTTFVARVRHMCITLLSVRVS